MSILYFAKIIMAVAGILMGLVLAIGIVIGVIEDSTENHEDEA